MYLNDIMLDKLIMNALSEDVGTGDITTESTIPETARAHGLYKAKESGVLCGIGVAARVFELIDRDIEFTPLKRDGDRIEKGEIIAEVRGKATNVLTGERVGLNLMQRMSGIATRTAEAVAQVEGTGAKICDTRKTTPGLRVVEKYAVKVGGGTNHRFNLADGILIKDNHIVAAGSITNAVRAARANAPHTLKIEVEVETFDELNEALDVGADIIMLDNMSCEDMKKAVGIVNGRAVTEASGNMGDRNLKEVADCGVDLISIGALTHSVRSLDISLKFRIE
ncbi:MAG: carboxylating nicotinate-nucleotide diphosphorylase [Eubacteriales bacterium]|nr:carboxylating nicotinate-nucleotide diphosphorylase [Clostridiales bacterium]MDD7301171.1 carboxylating nicotinate-nucleotide diphosphorylase [Eubacteriales bacterium]MDY4434761.1 carboxylating nicotinate-nucleotide diphosphorylase [Candidatus Flemingibacterium sp.]